MNFSKLLANNAGISLDHKIYNLVNNISEVYASRGGYLCILRLLMSICLLVLSIEDELLHHEQNGNECRVLHE